MIRKHFVIGILLLAVVLAVLVVLPANNTVSAQGTQGVITKYVSNGDYAAVYVYNWPDWFQVFVTRGGAVQNPLTYLTAYIVVCRPYCYWWNGSGSIPNEDLQGSATNSLRLKTDLSTNPNFSNLPPGYTGVIDLQWNKLEGGFSVRSTGTQQTDFGTIVEFRQGNYEYTTATVEGTFLGRNVSAGFAQMGTNHNVQHTIQRPGPKPSPYPGP